MIAVIFEVRPKPGCRDAYLDIAADLRPLLAEIDGFISIERFQSLADPEKVLSLSGLSAHADRVELRSWLDGIPDVRRVALHHGEEDAQHAFAKWYAGPRAG